jgi:glutamine cyclotransferase
VVTTAASTAKTWLFVFSATGFIINGTILFPATIFAATILYMKRIVFYALLAVTAFSCGDGNKPAEPTEPTTQPDGPSTNNQPAAIGYQIVNSYPHDAKCFTEGLQYVDGKFLESAGQEGESNIRYTDLATGKVLKQTNMAKESFGEGCTVLNGKVYQMTYKENTCYVYDSANLKKMGQFTYNFGEGWGMTTNGKDLIVSNGGSNLFFIDPTTFKEIKRVGVTNEYGPVGKINELELIKGYVYANIWLADEIVKIDTATGKVVGVVNLGDLRGKTGIPKATGEESDPEVLNGIAYDKANNRIFITGKYWPKLFEVKFDN